MHNGVLLIKLTQCTIQLTISHKLKRVKDFSSQLQMRLTPIEHLPFVMVLFITCQEITCQLVKHFIVDIIFLFLSTLLQTIQVSFVQHNQEKTQV